MKRFATFLGILTTILGLAALGWAGTMELAGSSAAIAYVENTVKVKTGGADWKRADVGDVLGSGDHIKTGDGATAALVLSDNTMIKLAESTEFVLVDLRETENGNFIRKFQLKLGRAWADVTPAKDSTFEIEGPDAVAAVRGTAFEVDAGDQGTDVNVFEGTVESTSVADGEKALIGADLEQNSFQALRGRKGQVRRFDPAKADAWQQWNLKNRTQMQALFRQHFQGKKLTPEQVLRLRSHFQKLPPPMKQRLRQQWQQGKRPLQPGNRPLNKPPQVDRRAGTPRPGPAFRPRTQPAGSTGSAPARGLPPRPAPTGKR